MRFLGFCLMFLALPVVAETLPLTEADCAVLQQQGVITAANPVPCERLQRVSFSYLDFNGQKSQGQLLVLDAVAPQVEALMAALWQVQFPLQSALPMEQFRGNDALSMSANNSSAFNGRAVTGSSGWSKHAYGVAIDINPLQNPFLSFAADGAITVLPAASAKSWLNRSEPRPGKPARAGMVNEAVVALFARHGFMTWGGDWDAPIDYQHFEIGSRSYINELIRLTPQEAQASFNSYAARYRQCADHAAGTAGEVRALCVGKVRQ